VARPRFTGIAPATSLVRLYRAGVEVGSQQLTGAATTWTITPGADVAEGEQVAMTATAQVAGQNMSSASAPLDVTFDRSRPTASAVAMSNGGTLVARITGTP
jgi:hypothetical protein